MTINQIPGVIHINDFDDDDSITISGTNPVITWPFATGLDMSTVTIAGSDHDMNTSISPGNFKVTTDLEVDGDIKIGGGSLSERIDKIEQRLAILQPNPELESRWEQLKQLGEQYRRLEAELTEREYIFEQLKK